MEDIRKEVHLNVPFRMLSGALIERFVDNGFNPEIGLDAQVLEECSFEEFSRVAGRLREHSLAVTFHFPFMDLSPGSTEPAIRELTVRRFRQVIPLIPLFKPAVAVCHTGYDWRRYGFIRGAWLERSVEIWADLGRSLAREGCLLVLENVYEENPEEMAGLLEPLRPEGVGFCLDTGHQSVFSKTSLSEWVRRLAPYIRHLHLHDNNGLRDDHLALGMGTVDFKGLFRELGLARAHPSVTLEPHREEDVLPSLQTLRELWPW
jgi:sugar phosphate isomerase/epimerase